MKYKIRKAQLGSVLNQRTISGTKNKSGNIQWEDNFDITTPGKQAVMLPEVTVTPKNTPLFAILNTWYPLKSSHLLVGHSEL